MFESSALSNAEAGMLSKAHAQRMNYYIATDTYKDDPPLKSLKLDA